MGLASASNAKRFIEGLVGGKPQTSPVRSPEPGPGWITLKLAATWLSGKFAQSTFVDGKDTRLEQAAAILLDWGRAKKVEMLTLDEGLYDKNVHLVRHYFRRAEMEALAYKNAATLTLSTDPAGAYVNRERIDSPTPAGQVVIVVGTKGDTSAPSPAIPLPPLVRRRR